jgi:hypothetical protein
MLMFKLSIDAYFKLVFQCAYEAEIRQRMAFQNACSAPLPPVAEVARKAAEEAVALYDKTQGVEVSPGSAGLGF